MSSRGIASASMAGFLLTKAGTVLSALVTTIWWGARQRYHPEDHYMRGPSPKWRAKHGSRQTKLDTVGPIATGRKCRSPYM